MTRIVRGPSPPPADGARTFAASVRVIASERFEARLASERTLAAARLEADELRRAARIEGLEAGRADAHAEVAATLVRARTERDAILERSVDVVVQAVRAVAERAVGTALSKDDAALASWVREALAPLSAARSLRLRASTPTLERLRSQLPSLPPSIELVADEALPLDGIAVASDLGDVALDLPTQLDDLVAAVRAPLEQAVRARHDG